MSCDLNLPCTLKSYNLYIKNNNLAFPNCSTHYLGSYWVCGRSVDSSIPIKNSSFLAYGVQQGSAKCEWFQQLTYWNNKAIVMLTERNIKAGITLPTESSYNPAPVRVLIWSNMQYDSICKMHRAMGDPV